jgi:hypothetical protein
MVISNVSDPDVIAQEIDSQLPTRSLFRLPAMWSAPANSVVEDLEAALQQS